MIPLACPRCGSGDQETYDAPCAGGEHDPWHADLEVKRSFDVQATLEIILESDRPGQVLADLLDILASWHRSWIADNKSVPAVLDDALLDMPGEALMTLHTAIAEHVSGRVEDGTLVRE